MRWWLWEQLYLLLRCKISRSMCVCKMRITDDKGSDVWFCIIIITTRWYVCLENGYDVRVVSIAWKWKLTICRPYIWIYGRFLMLVDSNVPYYIESHVYNCNHIACSSSIWKKVEQTTKWNKTNAIGSDRTFAIFLFVALL